MQKEKENTMHALATLTISLMVVNAAFITKEIKVKCLWESANRAEVPREMARAAR